MLTVIDRKTGQEITERVYGEQSMRRLYGSGLARTLLTPLAQRLLSAGYGAIQRWPLSRKKIAPFCDQFEIRVSDFEPGPFKSFDHFFTRRLAPGVRAFPKSPTDLGACAEGRYFAFIASGQKTPLPIKGAWLERDALLGRLAPEYGPRFARGPVLVCRLAPVDYHRFHFPDQGRQLAFAKESGRLDSVNPIALGARGDILFKNARHVSVLKTEHFGLLAMVEVGALMVGTIEQTSGSEFLRGAEKGMFHFGGSTVVLLGEAGQWCPYKDLLSNTARGLETLVRLGEPVGYSAASST